MLREQNPSCVSAFKGNVQVANVYSKVCSKCVKGCCIFVETTKVKFIEQKAAIYRLGTEGRGCQWNHRKPVPKASG